MVITHPGGGLWSWGEGSHGQLGHGDRDTRSGPMRVQLFYADHHGPRVVDQEARTDGGTQCSAGQSVLMHGPAYMIASRQAGLERFVEGAQVEVLEARWKCWRRARVVRLDEAGNMLVHYDSSANKHDGNVVVSVVYVCALHSTYTCTYVCVCMLYVCMCVCLCVCVCVVCVLCVCCVYVVLCVCIYVDILTCVCVDMFMCVCACVSPTEWIPVPSSRVRSAAPQLDAPERAGHTGPRTQQDVCLANIACGDSHSAAISTEGTLFTWGNGGSGRLGECCESPLPLELTVL